MALDIFAARKDLWTPPKAEIKLHNHYHAEIRDARSGDLVQEADAYNVLTNHARTTLANGALPVSLLSAVAVGTSVNAPSPTDEYLGAQKSVAGVASEAQIGTYQSVFVDYSNDIYWVRRKYQFSELAANFPLTEVGLHGNSIGPTSFDQIPNLPQNDNRVRLYSRALFRDANGNPITVTKTGNQIMTITATIFVTRGGTDSGMVMLDRFIGKVVGSVPSGDVSFSHHALRLGQGSGNASRARETLAGAQLAAKGRSAPSFGVMGANRWFWDAGNQVWTTVRPSNMPYVSTRSVDWELNEANGTFSELLWFFGNYGSHGNDNPPQTDAAIYVTFPCGTVEASSYTKNNQTKLRHYLEYMWN